MKVLQIANDYLGTVLYPSLFNALSDVGVTNLVFVPVRKGQKHEKESEGLRKDNGSSLVVSPCFSSLDRLLFYSKQKKINSWIHRMIDLDGISCVHAHTLFSAGYTAMCIKRKRRIPFITAVRNVDLNVFFKRMKHLRGVGIDVMREAERVIFLSPAYKETVLNEFVPTKYRGELENKSLVIPNGISDFFLENKPPKKNLEDSKIHLIYAGEINRNKNLSKTIEACKILIEEGYECNYTVVGNVTDKSCEKLLWEDFITHYSKCGHDELIKRYRENDIFIMPSHTETFGLVYAEAMSQGLPVIYTKGQGFDGYFPEGTVGYHVDCSKEKEIAKRILDVKSNYEEISKNCMIQAKMFDWDEISKQYKEIYQSII